VRALQESSRSQSAGQGRVRLRRWLLSLEVGLTVILLVGAGLLLKSYERLRSVDMGCVTKNVLTMQFSLPEEKYSQPVQRANFFSDLIERVHSLPGVRSAGLVRKLPGQGYAGDTSFSIAEHPPLQTGQMQYAMVRWADAGYFAAMGIPILRGHTFDEHQWLGGASQVIISESFAHQYFEDVDPIGKHLLTRVLPAINPTLFQGRHYGEIVGVVGDTRFQVSKDPQGAMYFPIYSGTFGSAALAVQSDQEVSRLALPIQRIVQQLDPDLAVADILTMDQIIGQSAMDSSFNATLLFVFAVFSLVLAAVGLFGVLSYLVAQRTTEIGIRIALGAQRDEVLRLTLLDGLRPALIGLVIGLFGSIAAAQLIRSMLYGINPFDPAVFVCVAAILILVATAACVAPAWQASRLDPMTALRSE
jgi:predicted permease